MIRYGFFNSIDNDRVYNADDISTYLGMLYTDGIIEGLTVSGTTDTVNVATGTALIENKYIINDSQMEFTITSNNTSSERTDYIYIYCDTELRECGIGYSAGTSNISTSNRTCLMIYQFVINANSSTIKTDSIVKIASVSAKVTSSGNIKREQFNSAISNCTRVDANHLTLNITNNIMLNNYLNGKGYFNFYLNGQRQRSSQWTLSVVNNVLTLGLNNGTYVYAKDTSNFNEYIEVEHVYLA